MNRQPICANGKASPLSVLILVLAVVSLVSASRPAAAAIAPPGNALQFDGVDDYVNVGHDASFNVGNTLTIEAWIKPTSLSSRYGVFSTRLDGSAGSFQLEVGIGSGGVNRLAVTGVSTWVAETGDNALAPNQWTHIAYTRTGTGAGTHTLYVNGVAQTLTSDADYTFVDNSSDKVIGSGIAGGVWQYFPGQIDEVRVWNTARTQAEIQDAMHHVLTGTETGLVAYYRFDEGSGTTTADLTANDNTGTLVNGPTWVTSTFPCANVIASRNNIRGVWSGNLNSLASSRFSVANASVSDPDFAVFGHDNGADAWQAADVPTGIFHRLTRVWQTEVSGSGSGDLVIDTSGLTDIGDGSSLRLLVDLDGTFNNATVVSGTFSSPNFTVSGQTLTTGIYYATLGNTSPFVEQTGTGLPAVNRSAVAWGDYDNDGYLDLILTGIDTTSTRISSIYRNNHDGTFVDSGAVLPGVSNSAVAWGDYDNDGYLDFILTGTTDGTASGAISSIYHNDHAGTFSDSGAVLPGVRNGSVAWGDFDNDGYLDFVLAGATADGGYITRIYHNKHDGTFDDIGAGLPGVINGAAVWGDYDNDGRLDIALAGYIGGSTNITRIYHNNGDGTFAGMDINLPPVNGYLNAKKPGLGGLQ